MKLKIRSGTVGYNNIILASDGNISLGKNDEVNLTVPVIKSHKTNSLETPARKSMQMAARPKCNSNDVLSHAPAISQKNQEPKTITHNDEKLLWYWLWQVVLQYGIFFNKMYGSPSNHYINHMPVSLIINCP